MAETKVKYVRYLDRSKVVDTGSGGRYGFAGVPLSDLTEEQWEDLPEHIQKSVDASPLYRKTKPQGWRSQEDLDREAIEEWEKAHPQEAKAQAQLRKELENNRKRGIESGLIPAPASAVASESHSESLEAEDDTDTHTESEEAEGEPEGQP